MRGGDDGSAAVRASAVARLDEARKSTALWAMDLDHGLPGARGLYNPSPDGPGRRTNLRGMRRCDVLVLGGGVAGASLAYHLGRAGVQAALVERHPRAGVHASGRNARLVLQAVREPAVRALVAASAAAYAERAGEIGFERCGSLQLGAPERLEALRDPALTASRVLDAPAARGRVALLAEHRFAAALETPGDGVLDAERLLEWYLTGARRAGVEVMFGACADNVTGSGRTLRVETTAGAWEAARVVDATGAWAGALAPPGGPRLAALKRHLFLLDHRLPPGEPYVWDLERGFYFRRDGAATLACMCDEEPDATLAETVSAGAEERLRQVLAPHVPALARAPLVRAWACFRTYSSDRLPVLGPDGRDERWWWLAGLGGHGLSSSWEVGRLTAAALVEGAEGLPPALRADRPAVSGAAAPPAPPAC